jgi:hypothetical protein
MTPDLTDHLERKRIVLEIHKDVDAFCKREFEEDARTHLGASIIGHDCKAYAWNTFRWVKFEEFTGRMLRLFNRGHEEERRFIRWLVGAGFTVHEIDPESGKQFKIVGVMGHFGGSLDSILYAPVKYNINEPLAWLGEFKTHNDKSFKSLKKDGVTKSKPQHFRQMCSYGRAYGFKYALYCAVNKNDDELYFEIVPLDYRQADDLFRKAEGIITAQNQPPKIAQTETFITCKMCDFKGICHRKELPTKNCRSCVNAIAIDNAEWGCKLFQSVIPKDFIPQGCDNWKPIING